MPSYMSSESPLESPSTMEYKVGLLPLSMNQKPMKMTVDRKKNPAKNTNCVKIDSPNTSCINTAFISDTVRRVTYEGMVICRYAASSI